VAQLVPFELKRFKNESWVKHVLKNNEGPASDKYVIKQEPQKFRLPVFQKQCLAQPSFSGTHPKRINLHGVLPGHKKCQ